MAATVRTAEPRDAQDLARLHEEMDRFYGATDIASFDLRIHQIDQAIFSDPPAAFVLLAREGARAVGFATYSFLWPARGLTRSLYLKELYVAEDRRRSGLGRSLVRSIFDAAAAHGCSRVEWTTDDDNTDAMRFYEKLGLRRNPSKVFYRSEEEDWPLSALDEAV